LESVQVLEAKSDTVSLTGSKQSALPKEQQVKFWASIKQHFALGIMLSGTVSSIIAWMVIEWKWPWFLLPVKGLIELTFRWLLGIWVWLGGTTPVYRWWYAVLGIVAAVSLIILAYPRIRRYLKPVEPDKSQYTEDKIAGIVWRWVYVGPMLSLPSLTPFCPTCDRKLDWKDGDPNHFKDGKRTFGSYNCREHNRVMRVSEPYDRHRETVVDEIMLKLRNGSWKKAMKRRK
jgi:hypothetical protein